MSEQKDGKKELETSEKKVSLEFTYLTGSIGGIVQYN